MKNAFWFLLGIIGGFVAAHLINKDPRGHEMLAEVDSRITEFTDRIGDAYRAQEARMDGLVAAASELAEDLKGAAADAVGSAGEVASELKDAASDALGTAGRRVADLTD